MDFAAETAGAHSNAGRHSDCETIGLDGDQIQLLSDVLKKVEALKRSWTSVGENSSEAIAHSVASIDFPSCPSANGGVINNPSHERQ